MGRSRVADNSFNGIAQRGLPDGARLTVVGWPLSMRIAPKPLSVVAGSTGSFGTAAFPTAAATSMITAVSKAQRLNRDIIFAKSAAPSTVIDATHSFHNKRSLHALWFLHIRF